MWIMVYPRVSVQIRCRSSSLAHLVLNLLTGLNARHVGERRWELRRPTWRAWCHRLSRSDQTPTRRAQCQRSRKAHPPMMHRCLCCPRTTALPDHALRGCFSVAKSLRITASLLPKALRDLHLRFAMFRALLLLCPKRRTFHSLSAGCAPAIVVLLSARRDEEAGRRLHTWRKNLLSCCLRGALLLLRRRREERRNWQLRQLWSASARSGGD
mmetsp:Transcript_135720/g.253591  ORF Transcript_135720/g.253591 Transcript_135720/m.253591 type:complete len:212 (+) Transcript_135720:463-1098(+)